MRRPDVQHQDPGQHYGVLGILQTIKIINSTFLNLTITLLNIQNFLSGTRKLLIFLNILLLLDLDCLFFRKGPLSESLLFLPRV